MAVVIKDPRYNLSFNLNYSLGDENSTRTISYVNLALGGSSNGYTPEDIYEFCSAVASLSGDGMDHVHLTSLAVNANYPIEYT